MAKGLTPLKVEKEKRPGRYADGGGLYLQVAKTGTKAWLFRFQLDGRERFMGLGSVKTFSLKEARLRARAARQVLSDGIDPIEDRLARRDAERKNSAARITFKEAMAKFLATHADLWRNRKHAKQWEVSVRSYAGALMDRPVRAIDTSVINEALAQHWTRIPATMARVRGRVQRVCQWVQDGMPLPATGGKAKRHMPALPWQQLPAFMAELRERQGIPARALEFLILTASRSGEVREATLDEIDLTQRLWVIPASRTKTGREHRVPLSDRAVEILRSLPTETGNDHVFLSSVGGKGLGDRALLNVLQQDLGRNDVVVHGFRATFKTWCDELSTSRMLL